MAQVVQQIQVVRQITQAMAAISQAELTLPNLIRLGTILPNGMHVLFPTMIAISWAAA